MEYKKYCIPNTDYNRRFYKSVPREEKAKNIYILLVVWGTLF